MSFLCWKCTDQHFANIRKRAQFAQAKGSPFFVTPGWKLYRADSGGSSWKCSVIIGVCGGELSYISACFFWKINFCSVETLRNWNTTIFYPPQACSFFLVSQEQKLCQCEDLKTSANFCLLLKFCCFLLFFFGVHAFAYKCIPFYVVTYFTNLTCEGQNEACRGWLSYLPFTVRNKLCWFLVLKYLCIDVHI